MNPPAHKRGRSLVHHAAIAPMTSRTIVDLDVGVPRPRRGGERSRVPEARELIRLLQELVDLIG